ncbi:hypothetical protein Mapa_013582 [Marchantia paleacea]|nr:hypothetical protein Mapa_013582 [Marchantia paleacea]
MDVIGSARLASLHFNSNQFNVGSTFAFTNPTTSARGSMDGCRSHTSSLFRFLIASLHRESSVSEGFCFGASVMQQIMHFNFVVIRTMAFHSHSKILG